MMTEEPDFKNVSLGVKISWIVWLVAMTWFIVAALIFHFKHPYQFCINIMDALLLK